jgi:hypothetical protein
MDDRCVGNGRKRAQKKQNYLGSCIINSLLFSYIAYLPKQCKKSKWIY